VGTSFQFEMEVFPLKTGNCKENWGGGTTTSPHLSAKITHSQMCESNQQDPKKTDSSPKPNPPAPASSERGLGEKSASLYRKIFHRRIPKKKSQKKSTAV